ncbi:MAG: hypothetical protein KC656_01040, partial [Myxococcales bacterium]|nr:hypothetical protein [Myxococcales bacterium]
MNELTLRDWLVSPAAGRLTHDAFLEGLADRLRQAGVPLDRASASVQTRHPEVYVHAGIWTLEDGASVHARPRTLAETGRYLESPVIVVQRTLQSLRVDLRQEHPPYPVCRELKDEGYTDYLIQPLESAWGDASFASWS